MPPLRTLRSNSLSLQRLLLAGVVSQTKRGRRKVYALEPDASAPETVVSHAATPEQPPQTLDATNKASAATTAHNAA